ncbi:hypothetical protein [Clostridium boliviensis]|uniref:hypothetical protein n=1 Tax=Clostridium boliviensis TaxID=318465 RepID=UPI0029650EEC|nr:hypothetical protein [Clostridium boliviensis]
MYDNYNNDSWRNYDSPSSGLADRDFFAILVVLPIVSSWIIILTRGEKKQVVSAGLSEPIIIALVSSGGTVLAGIIVGGAIQKQSVI